MPSRSDVAAYHALQAGRIVVDADAGIVSRPDGRRLEHADQRAYGRVAVSSRPFLLAMAHRIVWMSAHGLIPGRLQINHINRIRWDNRLANLELVTGAGNNRHARNLAYDAIGPLGNVDIGWLDRLDEGDRQRHDDSDNDIPRVMLEIPGARRTPPSRRQATEMLWAHFK